jgi:hypothetical protein
VNVIRETRATDLRQNINPFSKAAESSAALFYLARNCPAGRRILNADIESCYFPWFAFHLLPIFA